jgi:hypothetical protein
VFFGYNVRKRHVWPRADTGGVRNIIAMAAGGRMNVEVLFIREVPGGKTV